MSRTLGPYVAGERPPPLIYQYSNFNGLPIDITGKLGYFIYKRADDAPVTRSAPVTNGPAGEQTHTWIDDDLFLAGLYLAELWVGTASGIKMASVSYRYVVRAAIAAPPWV